VNCCQSFAVVSFTFLFFLAFQINMQFYVIDNMCIDCFTPNCQGQPFLTMDTVFEAVVLLKQLLYYYKN